MHFIRELFSPTALMLLQHVLKKRISTAVKLRAAIAMLLLLWQVAGFAQLSMQMPVTLSAKNKPLREVLNELAQKTGFTINYQDNVINTGKKITIEIQQKPLAAVLTQLLEGTAATYTQQGDMIVLVRKVPAAAAPGKVTGKVIDEENGQPVIGATVKMGANGTITEVDGSYAFALPHGNYTAQISAVGYGTKEVADVTVKDNETLPLNVTLKREKGQLSGLVVRSSLKRESINSLFVRQKNAAELSDGISAEQINATPDKHVGETLKRITGVSTNDNRKVVVRGIAERYNVALLNGSPLPSTDIQERDFEFNLIPTNVVENIVVSKSITPDMPYGFAGGLVQITTKSVPTANFFAISAGVSINTRTTGKDFMGYKRGKYDFLGFDDGNRNRFPGGLIAIPYGSGDGFNPTAPDDQNLIKSTQVAEQNKRIGGTERLGTRTYQSAPTQNYQLSLGRVYSLSKTKVRSLGFVGSLSYRNTQNNSFIATMRRGSWSRKPTDVDDTEDENQGNLYVYNTTWGTLLNAGFKTEKHQINIYNLYSRIFEDRFTRIMGWTHENPKDPGRSPIIKEDDRPKFNDLLQNKIAGTHQLGAVKVEWNAARTYLKSEEKDAATGMLTSGYYLNQSPYFRYVTGAATGPEVGEVHRDQYVYRERNLSAELSAAYNFKLGKTAHTFKAGANIIDKNASYNWNILPMVSTFGATGIDIPMDQWGDYMDMKDKNSYLYYRPMSYSLSAFEAKSKGRGAFAMVDSKPLPNLRIVAGVRMDYFQLDTLKNGSSESVVYDSRKVILLDSVKTRWLPSVNITYTPFSNFNVRASYAESVVRPGLMENSQFVRYSPNYGTVIRCIGVESTVIKNYDAKLEWFPGAGEIISAGYFYKYFDKPVEYYAFDQFGSGAYDILITNSDYGKVKGWEFELRKNLGFLAPGVAVLENMYVHGNLTLQKSEVRSRERQFEKTTDGKDSVYYTYVNYPRALYGQMPVLYNLGLQYAGSRLSVNLMYNYMGYKTFVTANTPDITEYERPRAQLDAQISYKLLNGKMEAKLNMTNLTDAPFRFFMNDHSTFDPRPDFDPANFPGVTPQWHDMYRYKEGFTEKFEEGYVTTQGNVKQRVGDRQTFKRYVGRTFSLSISYNF